MVRVIIGGMKNCWEKSAEKMRFVIVWLRVENGKDFGGDHEFSPKPTKTQSLQIRYKMVQELDKIAHVKPLFFYLPVLPLFPFWVFFFLFFNWPWMHDWQFFFRLLFCFLLSMIGFFVGWVCLFVFIFLILDMIFVLINLVWLL